MNIRDYQNAMNQIVPSPELKKKILRREAPQGRHDAARRALRVAASVAFAALALAFGTSAALSASPRLRTAVLSFFHIEEKEQAPAWPGGEGSAAGNGEGGGEGGSDIGGGGAGDVEDAAAGSGAGGGVDSGIDGSGEDGSGIGKSGAGDVDVEEAEIGGLVKARYIKTDKDYGISGDLLSRLSWSEDGRTLVDAKFWEIAGGEPAPVSVELREAAVDISFKGCRYEGSFYWLVRNGEICLFQGVPRGADERPEDGWSVEGIPGRDDAVLLKLSSGRQTDYGSYPMLYDLKTGETYDILAGTGADKLEYAYDYSWSEDMRRALILCSGEGGAVTEWFCDLEEGILERVDELTGLGGGAAACFSGSDTLIVSVPAVSKEDGTWLTVSCYAYDIPTGRLEKTLDEAPCHRWWEGPQGAQLFGSRCVLAGEDGKVSVVDLKTGEQTPIEGFSFGQGDKFMPSPSGKKLLYYSSLPGDDTLGIISLGVADLEKGTFVAFDREGFEGLEEEGIGWNDDGTVGIRATDPNGDKYLIFYSF